MAFSEFSEQKKEAVLDTAQVSLDEGEAAGKMKLGTKIKIGLIAICSIIILVMVAANSIRNKQFTGAVEEFCEDWEKLNLEMKKNKPDALEIDIRYKILLVDMREISKYYERLKSKNSANEYLADNINQYMFHEIVNYNEKESNQLYQFCDELYEFYKNPTEYLGVEILNIEFYSGADGFIHCRGIVKNSGISECRSGAATVYFRDKEGNVVKNEKYGLIGDNKLEGGDTREFDFNSRIKEGIVSCDMVIGH